MLLWGTAWQHALSKRLSQGAKVPTSSTVRLVLLWSEVQTSPSLLLNQWLRNSSLNFKKNARCVQFSVAICLYRKSRIPSRAAITQRVAHHRDIAKGPKNAAAAKKKGNLN